VVGGADGRVFEIDKRWSLRGDDHVVLVQIAMQNALYTYPSSFEASVNSTIGLRISQWLVAAALTWLPDGNVTLLKSSALQILSRRLAQLDFALKVSPRINK
jgi:hypothetical protein